MITPYIAEQLTELINEMIRNSTFPDIWKNALVTPLPKPGDPTNPSNYRPISSSLPILSKIAEKIMSSQIRQYLESNSLISPKQYGFREKHSTQSLLLQLSNKLLETLDNITGDKYVCLTYLDIKKAFDSVDHDLLLYKMCTYFNFHKSLIQLISSYLTSRQQCLKVNGVISQTMHVTSGVPQGSVLGPVFCIMFVNDLTKECPCDLFVDDCIVEQHGETPLSAMAKTNNLLPKISKWYSDNLLKLNAAKTSVLIVANKRLDTDNLNPVILQGKVATFTKTMK